ncbi:glycoside hydrolase family 18 protein [Roridomyces roridus]|uniref:chitinase n=1 Tax=Roridomyces roridus TaxID=1738132 RepID=A0AAD7C1D5_9AGAR|nr:glycoside hydrolase family 18 protein [Roridomyces roridus]
MISVTILAAVLVGGASQVMAYNASCGDNLAVYWGQNSVGGQQNLAAYCQDSTINAIPIAFLNKFFSTGGLPEINLANTCGIANGVFPGTSLANCQFLAADIEACQQRNKIVTLSLGGGTGIDALASDTQGIAFANTIWDLFLGGSSDTRPFGSAVLDGVDLDIEAGSPTGFAAFVNQIRNLSVGANKQYFVTAAPQCPFPDAHLGDALNAANFDAIYVQFYNNACGISTPDVSVQFIFIRGISSPPGQTFDFWAWDTWAKTVSPNKNVKIFIGAPASPAAADGYIDAETLGALAVSTRSQFSSFGGVMLWSVHLLR